MFEIASQISLNCVACRMRNAIDGSNSANVQTITIIFLIILMQLNDPKWSLAWYRPTMSKIRFERRNTSIVWLLTSNSTKPNSEAQRPFIWCGFDAFVNYPYPYPHWWQQTNTNAFAVRNPLTWTLQCLMSLCGRLLLKYGKQVTVMSFAEYFILIFCQIKVVLRHLQANTNTHTQKLVCPFSVHRTS